ncbi:hypothetical protein [Micromonospora rubida]
MIGAASRRLIAGVLGAGLALLGATSAARTTTPNDTSVSVGRLVLEPTDRGTPAACR